MGDVLKMMRDRYKIKHLIMRKNAIKVFFLIIILYASITGIFVFSKPKKTSQAYKDQSYTQNYYSNEIGPDRTIIINDPLKSGVARIKIIENAKHTLDIAYFSIETGESPFLFFAALIEAADRGVKVNLLLDGIFHGMRGQLKDIVYTFSAHPNMTLKYYEPLNIFLPWTANNRMHDKYILADNKIAIIGGRNIGDKYFNPDWYHEKVTNDRDIVIFNSKEKDTGSVLKQLSNYFDELWNHKYTKPSRKKISRAQYNKGLRKGQELKADARIVKQTHKELFEEEIDLMALSSPTNKVTLINNSVERFSKEPRIWYEISQLIKSAKESVFIQSPYVIPSKQMMKGYFNKEDCKDIKISILTNSLASSPNIPAYSGYMNHRKKIVDCNIHVYELQSINSTHAKSFVIDDDLLLIGSFNLDSRSTYLSTESMVVIHSPQLVKEFEKVTEDYIDHSLLVGKDYNYIPKDGLEEEKVRPMKKNLIKSLSYITRFFEYLL